MIHMLSRFDLKPGIDRAKFEKSYFRFFEQAKELGLAEATGKIGRRVADTPMDTDADDAQEYYVVMSFSDRNQLDRAYEFFLSGDRKSGGWAAHQATNASVANPVFTCWEDNT